MNTRNNQLPAVLPTLSMGLRLSIATLALTFCASASTAQSTPTPPSEPTPPSKEKNVQRTDPSTQNPGTSQQGWIFFDDRIGSDLGLDDEQLREMQKLDDTYRSRYDGFGRTPSEKGMNDLTMDREDRVKGMLTPEQYDQWSGKYGSGRHATGTPDGGMRVTTPKK